MGDMRYGRYVVLPAVKLGRLTWVYRVTLIPAHSTGTGYRAGYRVAMSIIKYEASYEYIHQSRENCCDMISLDMIYGKAYSNCRL